MKLSVVLVHYRTPELAAAAVESVRRELARPTAAGLAVEILVVDNGSDAAGRARLADLPVELVEPGENLGFAGGVNLGVERAGGDAFVLANPDVELLPGCLPRLAAALAGGAAAAGPRLVWDRGGRLLLPPTERRGRASELLARLADRGPRWAAFARRRWRRHARRHWRATEAIPSLHLSGALLAVARPAWERVGPFDEGYRLYFEETDWLLRLHRAGLAAVYEPRAVAAHAFARSAAREPRAEEWFEASRRRFAARWYGERFERIAGRIGGAPGGAGLPLPLARPGRPALDLGELLARPRRGPLWVEVSPLARGFPAAAERLEGGSGRWELPVPIWEGMTPGTWRLTLADERGRELAAASFVRPEGGR